MKDFEKFESDVRSTLSLKGFRVVHDEMILGHKKIDSYFESEFMGKKERTAVECKNYSHPLTESQISDICSTYQPLIDSSNIDNLLIVTKHGLHPAAETHIQLRKSFFHQTLDELENSIIDFSEYIDTIEETFKSETVREYFIEPIGTHFSSGTVFDYRHGESLTNHICSRLLNGNQPLAVLGAYGVGKTTLAKSIYLMLCEKRRSGEVFMPVFIPLSKFSGEQNIEGLLGRVFTSDYNAKGYNFARFTRLNNRRKIILILDGLDEMRHMLRWEEFKFNIDELRKLINLNSRVLLLGRPTAFTNKVEYDYVINAKPERKLLLSADDIPFDEYELSTFDAEQIESMATSYYRSKNISGRRVVQTVNLVSNPEQKRINDLAKRPIQLMMLLEILPETNIDISTMTVWLLYSIFLDSLIDRELKNISRKAFGVKARRRFAQVIASWLWEKTGESSVSASEIPREVIALFSRKGDDLDAIRRDLVMSCFLSSQGGEALHFPHRSVQEFLVAEFLYEFAIQKKRDRRFEPPSWLLDISINEEIVEFLCSILNYDQFGIFLKAYLKNNKSISLPALENFSENKDIISHCLKLVLETEQDAVLLILLVNFLRKRSQEIDYDDATPVFRSKILAAINRCAHEYERNFSLETHRHHNLRYGAHCCVVGLVLSAFETDRDKYIYNIIDGFSKFIGHKRQRVERMIGRRHSVKMLNVAQYEPAVMSVLRAICFFAGKPVKLESLVDAFRPVLRSALVVDEWAELGGLRHLVSSSEITICLDKTWASQLIQEERKFK
ncbi:NACHT domain-containing protein [Rhodobium gokarnense]|uniref:GTPase SAR1 family protein n=1 Tax=Rhodobium gokarnense TaxID=364296 RepID=A0ABT3HCG9_9HYPH|nr:NACHT domain-containing protein [Rhodobium gokarnense]MCW2308039.1 GTPase SAR1 family protein [Rhodobium gokarnense]